jgi:hypothetical protein
MWKTEKEPNGMEAIVYDELPLTKESIRIKVVYNPNEKFGFDNAYKTFMSNYERLIVNQRLNK